MLTQQAQPQSFWRLLVVLIPQILRVYCENKDTAQSHRQQKRTSVSFREP